MMDLPQSPIEFPCRHCSAPAGEKCTSVPQATSNYVQVLSHMHRIRWDDFNKARNERAAFNDWEKKYGA